jgi:hypothetical protein
MNRRQPDTYPDTTCCICKGFPEDDFHFFVGCRKKWAIWREAVKEFLPDIKLETEMAVWRTLLLTDHRHMRATSRGRILSVFGLILASIWQLHWRCSIDKKAWSPEACLWCIRRNRWKWSMHLDLSTEEEENPHVLVAHMRGTSQNMRK